MAPPELKYLVDKYRPLAEGGISASDFHHRVRHDGVSPLYAIVLLRDLYGLGLIECKMIHGHYVEDSDT